MPLGSKIEYSKDTVGRPYVNQVAGQTFKLF